MNPSAFLRPDGTLDVPAGFSGGFDLSGWDVSLHPSRGVVFQPQAAGVDEWASLGGAGTGLNAVVYDIEFNGGVLYAGGFFTDAGGDPDADYIAKFSGGVWSSLAGSGSGLNNSVHDIEFDGGVLYAGGQFTDAGGDPNADRIAQFSSGAWSSLGGVGLGSTVEDIEIDSGIVYVGGSFTNAGGDSSADNIAKFSGGVWSAVGGGLNTTVRTIKVDGGVLYAGGSFINAGGDANADHIAKFDGVSWSSLSGTGLSSTVYDIEFDGGVLYVVGAFLDAGGLADADRIVQFGGGAWSSLGVGLDGFTYEVEVDGGVVYAGGSFSDAGGDPDADGIAQFSGGVWSAVGTGLGSARDIEFNSGVLYAGGGFTDAGGDPDADNIARFGAPPASSGGSVGSGGASISSKPIATSGVTSLHLGRIHVSIPASAIPAGQTSCNLTITESGESGAFGFTLDDTVWDVNVLCNGSQVDIFFDALTICIQPVDGMLNNKNVYHSHNGGSFNALAGGELPGYVCGQTRLLSLFTLGQLALPATGFAPGRVSVLPEQAAAYAATSLTLSIPKLGVSLDIVGVPQSPNGWDVSWLQANQAGYLYGTSYPTWQGNSVLTAHVWNADNTPGPFHQLKSLQHGDRFTVSMYGNTYTYEVRSNQRVSPSSLAALQDSPYSVITLITCELYSERADAYLYRRAVQAVLVAID